MSSISREERNRLIAEAYISGQSLLEVANSFSLGETTVHSVLKKLKVPRRPQRKNVMSNEELHRSAINRFLKYVGSSESDWCWPWLGCHDKDGYGLLCVNGQNRKAHRFSWEYFIGSIPNGILVCHDCPDGDWPGCVNPNHLFLGTDLENKLDSKLKCRTPTGDRNGSRIHPERLCRGEENGMSKLKESDVIEIRRLSKEGNTLNVLSRMFNISINNVFNIVHEHTWKHILR